MYVDDNMTYDQIGRMQRLSPETCRGIVSRYEEHGTPVADFRRKRTRCIPYAVQFICRPSFPHDEPVGLPPHDMSLCFDPPPTPCSRAQEVFDPAPGGRCVVVQCLGCGAARQTRVQCLGCGVQCTALRNGESAVPWLYSRTFVAGRSWQAMGSLGR